MNQSLESVRTKMVEGGRLIVPARFRRDLGLAKGDDVLLTLDGDTLTLRPVRAALARFQAEIRAVSAGQPSAVDELIAERRATADG
jgi:AbrB family looped-hinge helix DNA binding protein